MLKFAIDNGMLNYEYVQQQMDMKRRKDVIECHQYKIWQDDKGNWLTYFPAQPKGRKLVQRKSYDALEQLIYDFYEENNEKSFKNVIDEWMNGKLVYDEIEQQTYDRYSTDVTRFLKGTWIYKKDISVITEYDLEEFIKQTIKQQELTAKAYSGLRTIIRGAFKYAYKKRWTSINIQDFFDNLDLSQKIFKKRVKKEQVFTDSEVRKIEDWILEHDRSITNLAILLGFHTGLRVGEITALKHSDVDFEHSVLNVNKTEIKYRTPSGRYEYKIRDDAKTEAGNRHVVLNDKAMDVLNRIVELNPDAEYLIIGDKGRVRGMFLTLKLYYICDTLGIQRKSMHKARKTYCTKMINANVSDALIISQMGHTDITTSKEYYFYNNFDNEESKAIINEAICY